MLPSPLPSPSHTQQARWVPDEEVKQCQLCHKAFSKLTARKHHCRACGKVVCKSCSGNKIDLPGSGPKAWSAAKDRVCDDCHTLHTNSEAASISDNLSTNREVQAVLKANLNEKHHQIEAYRSFLKEVVSDMPDETRASASSIPPAADLASSTPFDDDDLAPRTPRSPGAPDVAADASAHSPEKLELQRIEQRARRTWKQVVDVISQSAEEVESFRRECLDLESRFSTRYGELQRLQEHVRGLEEQAKDFPLTQATRDMWQEKNQTVRSELDGLTRRAEALREEVRRQHADQATGGRLQQCRHSLRTTCALM